MRREYAYFVYILASRRNGTLYVGVTGDLYGRIVEHRDGLVPGFTQRHGVKTLVYFEEHDDIENAILAARVENRTDRKPQSRVAGSVARPDHLILSSRPSE